MDGYRDVRLFCHSISGRWEGPNEGLCVQWNPVFPFSGEANYTLFMNRISRTKAASFVSLVCCLDTKAESF